MTYGNDACEKIELCNKRTFFDSRQIDAETLQFCHFSQFCKKRKSFNFFELEKQKFPSSSLTNKKMK